VSTYERLNSALNKNDHRERVLDLTISLESLIPAQNEISYRFALYLSLINSANGPRRRALFDDFKLLYNLRSKIVHGTGESRSYTRDKNYVDQHWDKYVERAFNSIFYYIVFVNHCQTDEWVDHLLNLALDNEPRINS
jgi:hypothetical protein